MPSVATLALVGCSGLEPLDLVVSPEVPTSVRVTFDAPADAEALVRVEDGSSTVATVPTARTDDDRATASVVGLRGDTKYRFVGVIDGDDAFDGKLRTADPPDLDLVLEVADPSAEMARGFAFLAVRTEDWDGIVAVDGKGEPVWWSPSPAGWEAAAPRLTRDGRGVLYLLNDSARQEEEQRLVRVELDGSSRTEWPVLAGHHMAAELPDGDLAWLSWDIRTVPWRGGDPDPVLSDRLLIGDGTSEPREILSFFDDRGPAFLQCPHAFQGDRRLGRFVFEWTHANSLVHLPERGSFVVMARFLDAILEVDEITGEVRWQAGGRDATLAFEDPADAFFHAHMSDAWVGTDGWDLHLLMFDNGGHDRDWSRVVEYGVDPGSGTVRQLWEHPHPDRAPIRFLGDARRLPGGNTLIAWTTDGTVDEVDEDGRLLWRVRIAEEEVVIGRIWYSPSLR